MTTGIGQPALRLEGISKRFGVTQALRDVSLQVGAGSIHSVLGANGSGKSTLIKILSGYYVPDGGARVWVRGQEESFPLTPTKAGIAIVHQELGLLEVGSILENVGVSSRYGAGRSGVVSWRAERERVRRIMGKLGSKLDVGRRVSSLEPADRTIVGIARALRMIEAEGIDDPILLLDEPTVTLPPLEVNRLFAVMRDIAGRGGSVIFITHRLREALDITDTISVLRDGQLIESRAREGVEVRDLVEAIHGSASKAVISERPQRVSSRSSTPAVLEVRELCGLNVQDVSFSVGRGEVVGVTGLAGMGQDTLPYLLTGASTPRSGDVLIEERSEGLRLTPRRAWSQGIALVPANRSEQAIWAQGTVSENYTIVGLGDYVRGGRLSHASEQDDAAAAIEAFSVRARGPRAPINTLSGGNQQKVVISRALRHAPKVLLLHEPFIGIDAAARAEVLEIIERVAADGCAVLLFSIEYELLASSCDRVLVMSHGQVVSEMLATDLTETAIARVAQEA